MFMFGHILFFLIDTFVGKESGYPNIVYFPYVLGVVDCNYPFEKAKILPKYHESQKSTVPVTTLWTEI